MPDQFFKVSNSVTEAIPVTLTGDNGASITVDSRAYRAVADITRPANITAYTALDVLGAGSGDGAVVTLGAIGPSGGYISVQSVELVIGINAVPAGMAGFRLHLYSSKPGTAADNSAFDLNAVDRSKYIGYVDLSTPIAMGSSCFAQAVLVAPGKLVKLDAGSTSLFCELQTIGGFTPAANSEVYSLRVNAQEVSL